MEQGQLECAAHGHHIGLRENELGGPLPVLAQLCAACRDLSSVWARYAFKSQLLTAGLPPPATSAATFGERRPPWRPHALPHSRAPVRDSITRAPWRSVMGCQPAFAGGAVSPTSMVVYAGSVLDGTFTRPAGLPVAPHAPECLDRLRRAADGTVVRRPTVGVDRRAG
jgi:hypothetical protein